MYSYMAHYVAKTLDIRPNTILDEWGVPELLVAFGQYANEIAYQNFEMWKQRPIEHRGEKPRKRIVRFMGLSELEEDDG